MSKKIVIVEDNLTNLDILKDILNHNGYKAIGVSDSRLAIDTIRKQKPALIIMDLMLNHGILGIDLIKELRTKKSFKTPIIGTTSETGEVQENFYSLCDKTIPKPLSVGNILTAVNEIIG